MNRARLRVDEDPMNASVPRPAAEINLDEFERRLRAAGAQQANWEDPLAELAKLVESSNRPAASPAGRQAVEAELRRGLAESDALRPAFDNLQDELESEVSGHQARPDLEELPEPVPVTTPHPGRPIAWKASAVALGLAGVAMIGGVFALRHGVPGLPKEVPFIAAAQGPTRVQPPSEDNVGASSDSGANLLKDNGKAAVKVVTSEEQPVDLAAQGSTRAAPPPSSPPAQANVPGDSAIEQTTDTPVVVATTGAPPPLAPQFPDPKPVRTVSLRPDGTPIPLAEVAPAAAPASVAGTPPAQPAVKSVNDASASAMPSTPKIELPTKLSGKSSARVAVPKTETTALTDGANESAASGAAKPEKPAKTAKTQIASAEPAVPSAPAQPVDAAAGTGGWAVQLAAPKSEADAKSAIERLNAKYAAALNGATIGAHKALVNGETIYRLRVVGLSKADAAALCARLKGEGGECFVAR
jgi:hypothetical protein